MSLMKIALFSYLALGSVYALYIWIVGSSPWYALPVNIVGGPVVALYHLLKGFFYKPRNNNL